MKVFLDESVFDAQCFWMNFFLQFGSKVYLTRLCRHSSAPNR